MSFSATFQFVPGDEGGLNRFLLDHYLSHRAYVDALLAQTPSFAAVDLPIQRLTNWPDWLAAHQMMSQSAWTGAGGGQSTDFGSLKLGPDGQPDPGALQDWFIYHKLWHDDLNATLGI